MCAAGFQAGWPSGCHTSRCDAAYSANSNFPHEKINLVGELSALHRTQEAQDRRGSSRQHVKLVKFPGAFVWHHHAHRTSCSTSSAGSFDMEFRDARSRSGPGRCSSCRAGVEHRPVAEGHEGSMVLLFERPFLGTPGQRPAAAATHRGETGLDLTGRRGTHRPPRGLPSPRNYWMVICRAARNPRMASRLGRVTIPSIHERPLL